VVPHPTFPESDYRLVEQKIERFAYRQEWWVCVMGWKGVPVRHRMAIEEEAVFAQAIQGAEDGNKRYIQERSLFGFSTSSLSAISCYSFSLLGMAGLADKKGFGIKDAKQIKGYPREVLDKLSVSTSPFKDDQLTESLRSCLTSPEYKELSELRNGLDHRGIVGRSITLGQPDKIANNVKGLPGDTDRERVLDETLSGRLAGWLNGQMHELIGAAASFATRKL
jgi:hypothetical protein